MPLQVAVDGGVVVLEDYRKHLDKELDGIEVVILVEVETVCGEELVEQGRALAESGAAPGHEHEGGRQLVHALLVRHVVHPAVVSEHVLQLNPQGLVVDRGTGAHTVDCDDFLPGVRQRVVQDALVGGDVSGGQQLLSGHTHTVKKA